jgi:argininosuccinate lyase
MMAAHAAYQCVQVMELTFRELEVREEVLMRSFAPEIYATDKALELVASGTSFRDAYRQVGLHLDDVDALDPVEVIASRTSTGTPGNLRLDKLYRDLELMQDRMKLKRETMGSAVRTLLGNEQPLEFFKG